MKTKGKNLILLGLLLIAAALLLSAYNSYDAMRAEQSAQQATDILMEHLSDGTLPGNQEAGKREDQKEIPDYILNPDMDMPVERINGIDYVGVLSVPSLNLELPVISQWSDPNLKIAPCRYSGSAYTDDLLICGHNYRGHFGKLKTLQIGEIVVFEDMDGNLFPYTLVEQETLLPTSIEEMNSGDWDMTLFTCTMGGKSRVTLRFEKAVA